MSIAYCEGGGRGGEAAQAVPASTVTVASDLPRYS
jgi:hypothetical protein